MIFPNRAWGANANCTSLERAWGDWCVYNREQMIILILLSTVLTISIILPPGGETANGIL